MEKKLDKALDKFLDDEEMINVKESNDYKKIMLDKREGLIERVDKIFVDKDGRQLLREQY